MINKDSIVTAYDEHLTLVEWLQKVEKALDNAVLTNLGIAKLSDQGNIATYQVTATFADNTTIVSDTFNLPSTDIVTAFSNLTTLVNGFEARLGRALLTPLLVPSTRKVVTIDTNGAQDNVDSTELTTLMGNIVDSHGNKRFVEGDITLTSKLTDLGITLKYGKWSLSGTHLMIIIMLDFASGATTPVNSDLAKFSLPDYIYSKVIPLGAQFVNAINVSVRDKNVWYQSQTLQLVQLYKVGNSAREMVIKTSGTPVTTSAVSTARIQFDLIIDTD